MVITWSDQVGPKHQKKKNIDKKNRVTYLYLKEPVNMCKRFLGEGDGWLYTTSPIV